MASTKINEGVEKLGGEAKALTDVVFQQKMKAEG